jgi:hypothetical protein
VDEFSISQEELQGLPPELLNELSKKGRAGGLPSEDQLLIDIIEDNGGVAVLDKILIAIYRRTGEVAKRSQVNARLYRLTKRGLVFDHPSTQGAFCTRPV